MLLRLALFSALGLTVLSGLWRMFAEPTPESAAAALRPSKEAIAETQTKTTEVLGWISSQTPASIGALAREAKEDIVRSLQEEGSGLEAAGVADHPGVGSGAAASVGAGAGSPGAESPEAQRPPGIDWYRK